MINHRVLTRPTPLRYTLPARTRGLYDGMLPVSSLSTPHLAMHDPPSTWPVLVLPLFHIETSTPNTTSLVTATSQMPSDGKRDPRISWWSPWIWGGFTIIKTNQHVITKQTVLLKTTCPHPSAKILLQPWTQLVIPASKRTSTPHSMTYLW